MPISFYSMIHCQLVSHNTLKDKHKTLVDDVSVDAHVGKALFTEAIVGALRNQGKTVILVTHALHFLSECDYVYSLENGRIVAQGKYQDLIAGNATFARLMAEFGGSEKREEQEEEAEEAVSGPSDQQTQIDEEKIKSESRRRVGAGSGKLEGRLIVAEKRSTGSVSWKGQSGAAVHSLVLIPRLFQCTAHT